MPKRSCVILLTSVALVSCGGGSSTGGGGGDTGVVVPNPTPTPNPPTPPPPPPPAYATFANLTGDQTYASGCTGYGIGMGGFPVITGSSFYSREGTLSYSAATQSYRFFQPNSGGPGELFGPGDRDANPPAGTISFTRSGEGGGTTRLVIARPSPSGAYDYSRVALIEINKGGTGVPQGTYYCVLGVPTLQTDVPAGPIVNFTRFAVQGEAFDRRDGTAERYTLERSLVTMTVDVAAGTFVSVVRLIGTTSSGASVELGTYTVQGGLIEATGGLTGASPVQSSAADLTLNVSGGFFGPQGKEFGYYFDQNAYGTATPGEVGLIVRGVVSGER